MVHLEKIALLYINQTFLLDRDVAARGQMSAS